LRSPADFEEAAADWMRAWGFRSVKKTSAGRDGGIDVESIEGVAQVKAWMVPVGSPEVQQLRGAAHDGRLAVFFSLTDYTPAAVQFADQADVALFRFSGYNGEVEPVNPFAREVLAKFTRKLRTPKPMENVRDCELWKVINAYLDKLTTSPGPFVFVTFAVKHADNRFVDAISEVQPSWSSEVDRLIVGSVGEAYAAPALAPSELSRLAELGWPIDCRDDNYQIRYPRTQTSTQLEGIADLLAWTLIDVHCAQDLDDIEVEFGT
jgi:hypothetical protein